MAHSPKRATLTQAAAVSGTKYDLLNYTGSGTIGGAIGMNTSAANLSDYHFEITIDGGTAQEYDMGSPSNSYIIYRTAGGGDFGLFPLPTYGFTTSVLVQVWQDSGGALNLQATMPYGIQSEEIGRTVYPAGTPVPERDNNVYPVDSMVIRINHDGDPEKPATSSQLIQSPVNPVAAGAANGGAIDVQLTLPEFDTTLNARPIRWVSTTDTQYDGDYTVKHGDTEYTVAITAGTGSVTRKILVARADFMRRFTLAERANIIAASTAASTAGYTIKAFYDTLQAYDVVDLQDPEMTEGMDYLVSQGLITAKRKTEILAE